MNGVLVVNKPEGITSSAACLKVKRMLGLKKAGHLGTLDPMATGVLPLCLNEGTKLAQFLQTCDKEYVAEMKLGQETDTQDSQGTVVATCTELPYDESEIRRVVGEFAGEQLQVPPMFSAVKQGGVPLYRIARRGGCVPRAGRRITVHEIAVEEIQIPCVRLRVVCTAGTYIRTLCHDIGQRLGCGAHVTGLRRVRSGRFHLDGAVTIEGLAACTRRDVCDRHLISSIDALAELPDLVVDETQAAGIRNGHQLAVPAGTGRLCKVVTPAGDLVAVVDTCGDESGTCRTLRVFLKSVSTENNGIQKRG